MTTSHKVSIWRGGAYAHYDVPARESQTVLDVVTYVQRHLDPTLTYRFACRVGMCGSCAMTVNGVPRWTCRTHVSKVTGGGELRIGPLSNMPVIKDLACDTVRWNADYLGPAALNRAWTLANDERDGAQAARLKAVSDHGGCHACHSHQSCEAHCPNQLNPAASIAGLKRLSVSAYLKGKLK